MKTRRDFLRIGVKTLSAAGALTALGKLGEINALAAGSSYQALVCVFLNGGNDGNNMVAPIKTLSQQYSDYATARQGMGIAQSALLPITTKSNETYGINNVMPEIQSLYQSGSAAILANVGMLVVPVLTASAFNNLPNGSPMIPVNLFSHSDQATQWQSAAPNELASTGWGGRIADALQSLNAGSQYPAVISSGGCGEFCTGSQTFAGTVPSSGPSVLNGIGSDIARINGMQQVLTFDNGLKLVQAANGITTRAMAQGTMLNGLLASAPVLKTVFPAGNPLAAQMSMVARIIGVHSQLGLSRQIFYCSLGGFDTHGGQVPIQTSLLQQLSQAINAFYQATVELGVSQQVTTFTASEFGRTVMPNSSAGSDHAWGNHHLIVGGSVAGGNIYGTFPQMALGNPLDVTGRGSLIPTTAVDQYAATLAQWFGVPTANLPTVLPNLSNFTTQNLGFLG
jgi:uncharacterized protein (DUF1501 family)